MVQLGGVLPSWNQSAPDLSVLDLSRNNFTGGHVLGAETALCPLENLCPEFDRFVEGLKLLRLQECCSLTLPSAAPP